MYKNAEKFRLFRPNFKFLISLERYSNVAPLPVKRPGRPEAPLKVMDQLNLLVLRRLKGLGYARVGLAYAKGNPQSAAFWRKNGFHPTGRDVPAEGYTAVVLERELK